jgi:UDP-2,4-diacetamido-2,4,6-trideoxy-beta-L-altropyranose hydrolase
MGRVIVIRTDASSAIGTGHLMRCLALAQEWKSRGGDCVLARAEGTLALAEGYRKAGISREHIIAATPGTDKDLAQTLALASEVNADWIVLDGYQFSPKYVVGLRENSAHHLLIDDLGISAPYLCDIVLNVNLFASAKMYANRASTTRLLLGPQYALLRPEFTSREPKLGLIPDVAQRVLVSFGGSDPENVTLGALQSLGRVDEPELEVVAVLGPSNPHRETILAAVRNMRGVRVIEDVADMSELMEWADLAVTAAGGTCLELAYMGVPMLVAVIVPNQERTAQAYQDLGVALNVGKIGPVRDLAFLATVRRVVTTKSLREAISRKGRDLVDGKGARRVAEAMLMSSVGDRKVPTSVTMSSVTLAESEKFLTMALDHFRELNPLFIPDPGWKSNYFARIDANADLSLRWIVADGEQAGFILFGLEEHRFLPRKTGIIYELYVLPSHRRRGIAKVCAQQAIEELKCASPTKIQLEVVEGNNEAIKLWASLGFQKVTDRFVLKDGTQ